jgi:hypothetical protein
MRLQRMARLVGLALADLAGGIRDLVRRLDERGRLAELSPLERRDLNPHRVDRELTKWPWQH